MKQIDQEFADAVNRNLENQPSRLISRIQPLGQRILVRRYERPDEASTVTGPDGEDVTIYRSDAWTKDRSYQLFEVVRIGPKVNENLKSAVFVYHDDDLTQRTELAPDDIIKTAFGWQMVDAGDEEHYFVMARDVRVVHCWKEAETNDS